MNIEQNRCGFSFLIPMSCKERAEAFARSLQSRLSSLGSQDSNSGASESTWLSGQEKGVAVCQPKHSSESELYYGLFEPTSSPEEVEDDQQSIDASINSALLANETPTSTVTKLAFNDSDSSSGTYYDIDTDNDEKSIAGDKFDDVSRSSEPSINSETSYDNINLIINKVPIGNTVDEGVQTINVISSSEDMESNAALECGCLKESSLNGEDKEIYCSCLSIDKDLIVECPKVESNIQNIEIRVNETDDTDPEDDAYDEKHPPRVRKCSSLKTGKTPPGTPGRKKIVRFADVLGLDLADVKTYVDEIPKVPSSAYNDLINVDLCDDSLETKLPSCAKTEKILLPLFQQPGGQPNFLDIVRDKFVLLENAMVDNPVVFSIKGVVRVRNLDFHKSVHVRYSMDSWVTYTDVQAVYAENSCDGFSDKFTFVIYAHTLTIGQRLEFAVRFQAKGCQYWDNNNGINYCFQCLPVSQTSYSQSSCNYDDDHWGASFY